MPTLFKGIKAAIAAVVLFGAHYSSAQSTYNPSDLFPALPLLPPGNEYRMANGEPGPNYWQNRADYQLNVTLNDKTNTLTGVATITYTNNSPKALSALWMQLEQNVFKKDSRGIQAKLFLYKDPAKKTADGGYQIKSIRQTGSNSDTLRYHIYDTRMQVELPQPLKTGEQITFSIAYSYQFPLNYKNADFLVNRTDLLSTKNGDIYAVAQWYPRMCVLDDAEG